MFSAPRYRGPTSDHFDGTRFHNEKDAAHQAFTKVLKWGLTRKPGRWPKWIDAEPGPPPPVRVDGDGLRVTFVNHATVLVQLGGKNLLTDPVWGPRTSPVSFAGPKRVRPPGIRFADLPPIDAVLLSHNHYDHLDAPTVERLANEHDPVFFSGLGNAAFLTSLGVKRARDLDWWGEDTLDDLRVTFTPAQHFSGRGTSDRDATLWGGFVVEDPRAGRVFFAGDTGYAGHFRAVRERLGAPRLALLPIGAYLPRWFMAPVHMNPEEAVRAHRDLEAEQSVGIHFGTFKLADDGCEQPIEELQAALDDDERDRFVVLGHGEGHDVPRARSATRAAG